MTILRETEGEPPAQSGVLRWAQHAGNDHEGDPRIPPRVIWSRIEGWIAYRWAARPVEWIIAGPGAWEPRLRPFTVSTVERWDGAAWAAVTPVAGPLGYVLDDETYRITGTAGDDSTPPPAVLEAYGRLAEYFHGIAKNWNAEAASMGGGDDTRVAAWAAKGLHLSGASDLLRPWRGIGRNVQ